MDPSGLVTHPCTRRARALVHAYDAQTVETQVHLATIAAPSGQEQARGRYMAERFVRLGLTEVHCDEVGNVLARLGGTASGAAVIVSAHMDTVFAAETVISPRRSGGRIWAPGITDNARGLAALLTVVRVLAESGARPRRPLWFVATVGEEGAGDLRGVKHLFRSGSRFTDTAAFLSLDGSGLQRIVNRALGSRRFRVSVRGPGGHSWSDFGLPNPIHALGLAIARMRRIELPRSPRASLTVARFGGGTSINAIPAEAWVELDLRSEDAELLNRTEASVRRELTLALREEDPTSGGGAPLLSMEVQLIGDRPSGTVEPSHPLVRAAMEATRIIGYQPELVASSTDANVPISLGIPAVTIGAGGESGGVHTVEEWYENREGARGVERALLLTLAAAGLTD